MTCKVDNGSAQDSTKGRLGRWYDRIRVSWTQRTGRCQHFGLHQWHYDLQQGSGFQRPHDLQNRIGGVSACRGAQDQLWSNIRDGQHNCAKFRRTSLSFAGTSRNRRGLVQPDRPDRRNNHCTGGFWRVLLAGLHRDAERARGECGRGLVHHQPGLSGITHG